jgi:predicted Zn-dependent protease
VIALFSSCRIDGQRVFDARTLIVVVLLWVAPVAVARAISLISPAQEIEIGRKADAQLTREVPVVRDGDISGYVRSLGHHLAQYVQGPKYPYTFNVVDYREINAFALPGGPVWIHRGVLHAAMNESQVVGVLAHEISHISQRHAADQLTKAMIANWGIGLLGAMLGSGGGAMSAQVAASFLANGMFMQFSRDDEREADRVGLALMRRAGWDPRGMVELFAILGQESKRDPGKVEVFFSTHPSPQDRIERLQSDVNEHHGGLRNSRRFETIKARLLRMPPPKAMRTPATVAKPTPKKPGS